MGRYAYSVILHRQMHLLFHQIGPQRDHRIPLSVSGGILQQLTQNEHRPFIVRKNPSLQPQCLHPDAALHQQGTVSVYGFGRKLRKLYLPDDEILFRALRPCIE